VVTFIESAQRYFVPRTWASATIGAKSRMDSKLTKAAFFMLLGRNNLCLLYFLCLIR